MIHVNIKLSAQLLIRVSESFKHAFSELILQVETILVPEGAEFTADEFLWVRNSHVKPVLLFVSPGSAVRENLRFSAATLAPQEQASVGTLPLGQGSSTDVFRTPVMVAELLVTLHVDLVFNDIAALQIRQSTEIRLV